MIEPNRTGLAPAMPTGVRGEPGSHVRPSRCGRAPTRCRTAPTIGVLLGMVAIALTWSISTPSSSAAPSATARTWYFIPRGAHARPTIPADAAALLRRYDGIWIGPRRQKVLFLTFDAAAEIGTTARIIRILDRTTVKASFFLTGRYMRANPAMTRRITDHGHLVCNHTLSHPDMARLARSPKAFVRQIAATERACRLATGSSTAPFFRFPRGAYSARALHLAHDRGYTSVFWSFAHVDWNEHDQPPVSVTRARLLAAAAPGVIYLLHAGSKSNTDALASVIRELQRRGYTFATLAALRPPAEHHGASGG